MGDVVSVDAVIVEAEFAAQEGAGQLCDEFLAPIGLVAKLLPNVRSSRFSAPVQWPSS